MAFPTLLFCSATAAASTTLDDLSYRDPAPLQKMMQLSDAQFQDMLDQRWNDVEKVLYRYVPASAEIYPAPRSFYGPWQSCLQHHTVAACREHMRQLISLQQSKATQNKEVKQR